MRIKISPNRGELLRMKYRTELFHLSQDIHRCWMLLGIVNGEMAQFYLEQDLEDMFDRHAMIKKALYSQGKLKGTLP